VRNAVGDDTALMIDFNQGLNLADALQRCHAIDDNVVWPIACAKGHGVEFHAHPHLRMNVLKSTRPKSATCG
jgi:hypothetical protein